MEPQEGLGFVKAIKGNEICKIPSTAPLIGILMPCANQLPTPAML
jgi:hypothetical protein